jgi:hypothetical protein
MYNLSRIWASESRNTQFQLVFAINLHFFGKTEC